MDTPEVDIIIPTLNTKDTLETCLNSLFNQSYKQFRITIIDDASTDGTIAMLQSKFSGVKIIRNEKIIGREASRNTAIRNSNARYIATLDADTIVDRKWLEELVRAIAVDEDIGMCSCKILKMDKPHIIDNIGHALYYDFSPLHIGTGQKDRGQFERKIEIFGVCLTSALIRREIFNRVGFFDEDYNDNLGDDEWLWRARAIGYRCIYVPTAVVYHKKTSSYLNKKNIFIWERNRILSIIKYYSLFMAMKSIFYSLKRYFSYRPKEGNKIPIYRIIPIVLYAWYKAFIISPKFIKKRKNHKLAKEILNSRLENYLSKHWESNRWV